MKRDLKTLLGNTEKVNDCLEWKGCLNSEGYARANIDGDVNTKVHRVVFELSKGEDIQGFVVRHSCDNRKCINPKHLQKGTPLQNVQDRNERSGNGQAKLTKEKVLAIRQLANAFSQKQLAEMFAVDSRTISSIILRKHWKHIA
jgi:hypothetical protein